jgi:hypothetical protein
MFQNEYTMDVVRYRRWTTPIMHKAKGFWFWLVLVLVGLPAMVILRDMQAKQSYQTAAALLTLAALYRGFFFRGMYANKQFRLLSNRMGKKSWDTRILVDDKTFIMYVDGEKNNEVSWKQISRLVEAKSYIDVEVGGDFMRLDKAGFTRGDAAGFLQFVRDKHPEVRVEREKPAMDR